MTNNPTPNIATISAHLDGLIPHLRAHVTRHVPARIRVDHTDPAKTRGELDIDDLLATAYTKYAAQFDPTARTAFQEHIDLDQLDLTVMNTPARTACLYRYRLPATPGIVVTCPLPDDLTQTLGDAARVVNTVTRVIRAAQTGQAWARRMVQPAADWLPTLLAEQPAHDNDGTPLDGAGWAWLAGAADWTCVPGSSDRHTVNVTTPLAGTVPTRITITTTD